MSNFALPTWDKQDFINWYGIDKGIQIWTDKDRIVPPQEICDLKQEICDLKQEICDLKQEICDLKEKLSKLDEHVSNLSQNGSITPFL